MQSLWIQQEELLWQRESINSTAIHSTCNHCEYSRKNYCDKGKALIAQLFIVHAITVKSMKLQGNCCNKDKALIPQPKRYARFLAQHCENNESFLFSAYSEQLSLIFQVQFWQLWLKPKTYDFCVQFWQLWLKMKMYNFCVQFWQLLWLKTETHTNI